LPWLTSVIKSLELPGGFKIELQEAKAKAEEAIRTAVEAQSVAESAQTRARISETITRTASDAGTAAQPGQLLTKEQALPLASALVEEYLQIRKDNKPGPSRTQLTESKMIEMITLAKQWPDFEWQKNLDNSDKGWRLFSYAYVMAHPTFNKLDAVAESAWTFRDQRKSTDNRPFGEYWSIRAMQALAYTRGSEVVSTPTRSLLLDHFRELRSGTDRHYEMRQLLRMLEIPIPT
jgi:hypothetical protein